MQTPPHAARGAAAAPAAEAFSRNELLVEATALEAIRTLDALCSHAEDGGACAARIFPFIRRFGVDGFNRPSERTACPQRACVFLGVMQFFLNHARVVTFDAAPIFRLFFLGYLPAHDADPFVAWSTLSFCARNLRSLLHGELSIFSRAFPAILRIGLAHPTSFVDQLVELLPAMISPESW